MPEPSDIGSTIRKYRIKNGFSQKELGEKCGLTQQAINRIEHGKRNIESELLIKFVKILNIDFCDILEEMKGLESDEFTCIDTALHPEKWGWPNPHSVHFSGNEYTDEELEEIRRFAEFIKSKRKTDK